jgi:hypothetical protein
VAQRVENGEEKRSVPQNGSSVEQHAERAAGKARPWIERLARAGYVAYVLVGVRGMVFGVIGIFLVQAALQTDSDEARGLGAVTLGLVTFMFVMARHCPIEPA